MYFDDIVKLSAQSAQKQPGYQMLLINHVAGLLNSHLQKTPNIVHKSALLFAFRNLLAELQISNEDRQGVLVVAGFNDSVANGTSKSDIIAALTLVPQATELMKSFCHMVIGTLAAPVLPATPQPVPRTVVTKRSHEDVPSSAKRTRTVRGDLTPEDEALLCQWLSEQSDFVPTVKSVTPLEIMFNLKYTAKQLVSKIEELQKTWADEQRSSPRPG